MLILTRKAGESLMLDGGIEIKITEVYADKVRIGIEAPANVKVYRKELYATVQENQSAAQTASPGALKGLLSQVAKAAPEAASAPAQAPNEAKPAPAQAAPEVAVPKAPKAAPEKGADTEKAAPVQAKTADAKTAAPAGTADAKKAETAPGQEA